MMTFSSPICTCVRKKGSHRGQLVSHYSHY